MSSVENDSIEIIRNLKTQAWFVLLEELPGERYRVVNPTGEALTLPISHFGEEIDVVEGADIATRVTPAQVAAFHRFNQELEKTVANLVRQKEADRAERSSPSSSSSSSGSTPRKRNTSKVELPKSYYESKTARVSWQGAKLTFYRHHIDPLKAHQKFSINVVGTGIFEMTKDQFMSSFSDVILSANYKSTGLFSYDSVPDKAMRFLKKS
jgi:hypothetical protein